MRELLATRSTIGVYETVDALRDAAPELCNGGLILLTAHVHLETALKPWCFNLGNVKAPERTGWDFCMFACGEEVPLNAAEQMRAKDPGLIDFRGKPYSRGNVSYQSIWIRPPHSWTRFRAFDSLAAGADAFVCELRKPKWANAWAVLFAGGLPLDYAAALRKGNYFTADERLYATTLRDRMLDVRGSLMGKPTLKLGMGGTDVEEWQRVVTSPVITGKFDADTRLRTINWQKARGLVPDGVVGNRSWATALPAREVL